MTAAAKLYAAKFGALFVLAGLLWVLQTTFLEEPVEYLVPFVLLAGGLYLGFFETTPLGWKHERRVKMGVGIALALFSCWAAVPPAPEAVLAWQPYSEQALGEARREGKPVMIDFFASWCEPCLKLDRAVFGRRTVVGDAARFAALRADVSDQASAGTRALSARFQIEALPTVVFIGSDGKERAGLRVVGTLTAAEFRRRMAVCR